MVLSSHPIHTLSNSNLEIYTISPCVCVYFLFVFLFCNSDCKIGRRQLANILYAVLLKLLNLVLYHSLRCNTEYLLQQRSFKELFDCLLLWFKSFAIFELKKSLSIISIQIGIIHSARPLLAFRYKEISHLNDAIVSIKLFSICHKNQRKATWNRTLFALMLCVCVSVWLCDFFARSILCWMHGAL